MEDLLNSASDNTRYNIKLEFFEGPIDLLLYLVKKDEIDIRDIKISRITDQYLEFLGVMKELHLEIAGEFMVMASILMRLKANELLPKEEQEAVEVDGEIIDREKLIQQMEEYQKFKLAAHHLKNLEHNSYGTFFRGSLEQLQNPGEEDILDSKELSIFALVKAFKDLVENSQKRKQYYIDTENISIDDRIEHVIQILYEKNQVDFEYLFSDNPSRMALVVTFIAILELVRMGRIGFRQHESYSTIVVYKVEDQDSYIIPENVSESVHSEEP
ncbi:MAG: segregation/condensation protein A [bacterium]